MADGAEVVIRWSATADRWVDLERLMAPKARSADAGAWLGATPAKQMKANKGGSAKAGIRVVFEKGPRPA